MRQTPFVASKPPNEGNCAQRPMQNGGSANINHKHRDFNAWQDKLVHEGASVIQNMMDAIKQQQSDMAGAVEQSHCEPNTTELRHAQKVFQGQRNGMSKNWCETPGPGQLGAKPRVAIQLDKLINHVPKHHAKMWSHITGAYDAGANWGSPVSSQCAAKIRLSKTKLWPLSFEAAPETEEVASTGNSRKRVAKARTASAYSSATSRLGAKKPRARC